MKLTLFLCYTFLACSGLFAQLPKGPGGKDLFQKGDCKVIISNVKYECEFCEDKELTRNCKTYDCSLTECKEQLKPGESTVQPHSINIEGKQVRMGNSNDGKPANRIDITENFKTKKVKNGTVVIYESKGIGKVYGVYKNNQLKDWYLKGEDGKRINPTAGALNATSCATCIVLSNGNIICTNCTITPQASTGTKSQK